MRPLLSTWPRRAVAVSAIALVGAGTAIGFAPNAFALSVGGTAEATALQLDVAAVDAGEILEVLDLGAVEAASVSSETAIAPTDVNGTDDTGTEADLDPLLIGTTVQATATRADDGTSATATVENFDLGLDGLNDVFVDPDTTLVNVTGVSSSVTCPTIGEVDEDGVAIPVSAASTPGVLTIAGDEVVLDADGETEIVLDDITGVLDDLAVVTLVITATEGTPVITPAGPTSTEGIAIEALTLTATFEVDFFVDITDDVSVEVFTTVLGAASCERPTEVIADPSPSGSASPSASVSPSGSVSPSASVSPSGSASPSPSASASPSGSVSPSASVSPSGSVSPTPSGSVSPTPSGGPDDTTVLDVTPNSGPEAGGTRVTITGANLDEVSDVNFGTVAGTSLTVNETGTILTVTTPPGTGAVDITLVLSSGDTVDTTEIFTYIPAGDIDDGDGQDPDLSLIFNQDRIEIAAGASVVVQAVVANTGTAPATNAVVTVTLPEGIEPTVATIITPSGGDAALVADRAALGDCADYDPVTGTLVCQLADLAAGVTTGVELTLVADASLVAGLEADVVAEVIATENEVGPGVNSDTLVLAIVDGAVDGGGGAGPGDGGGSGDNGGPSLPVTGVKLAAIAAAALSMLGAGGALLLISRRRREESIG